VKPISDNELQEIIEMVWMTALEHQVARSSEYDLASGDCLTSEIEITGAWHGVVNVRASAAYLKHAASSMFSIDIEDVKTIDCEDTLKELTNMLGGTVKCLLPETCDLSLPRLRTAGDSDDIVHDWLSFNCQNHPFAVAVTQCSKSSRNAA
jgi:CheY-specific phosphatase CheX